MLASQHFAGKIKSRMGRISSEEQAMKGTSSFGVIAFVLFAAVLPANAEFTSGLIDVDFNFPPPVQTQERRCIDRLNW